jgi:diaminohydroxyphosphoribosylaminopyrimidine deaminase/5-amino-6-(5-phosphoribosylamino)uracil reductase
VVRDDKLLGEGWHERYGQAHAEINALLAAGAQAREATLYVTLEPCCHHGKTPPCTDAMLRAGIGRVVAAMPDPFPQVAGQGIRQLQAAGVNVEVGLGEAEARRLNAPYLKLLKTGQPYVHAKWAMSLDGKIATRTGNSKWISGEAARRRVHELRGRMDAVIIGRDTALADDPLLTVRVPGPRTPLRIVLCRSGLLSPGSQLVKTARETPLLLVASNPSDDAQAHELRSRGCELLTLTAPDNVSLIPGLLGELGRRQFTNVLVEGGSAVLGSFHDARAIDEVHVFIAPKLIGGAEAIPAIAGQGIENIADALLLADCTMEEVDGDFLLHGRVKHGER